VPQLVRARREGEGMVLALEVVGGEMLKEQKFILLLYLLNLSLLLALILRLLILKKCL